ncbi:unnamed protein product [Ambrosiozyma monospora]|uniref:Unnamed protein product n=1 Tax=Ambrosiozyma monospora TaxID=43982 RepID=A0A9W6YT95_AMBMO|nr:unnamed protein product [Ambrosiozyma monospora]
MSDDNSTDDTTAMVFQCGPTNMTISPPFNESVAAAIYGCGLAQQLYYKNSKSSTKKSAASLNVKPPSKGKLMVLQLLILMCFFTSFTQAYSFSFNKYSTHKTVDSSESDFLEVDSLDDPDLQDKLRSAHLSGTFVFDAGSNSILQPMVDSDSNGYENGTLSSPEDGVDSDEESSYFFKDSAVHNKLKREVIQNTTQVIQFKQWQATQSNSTDYTDWLPASCCYYCDTDPSLGSCNYQLDYGYTYSWSISSTNTTETKGLDWKTVKKLLGDDDNLVQSYTFSISGKDAISSALKCEWSQNDGPLQYMIQQGIKTASVINRNCNGGSDTGCSDWSRVVDLKAPLKGVFNIGCNTGWDNVHCSDVDASQHCYFLND